MRKELRNILDGAPFGKTEGAALLKVIAAALSHCHATGDL